MSLNLSVDGALTGDNLLQENVERAVLQRQQQFDRVGESLRQAQCEKIEQLIKQLKQDGILSEAEKTLLRQWIVGDACSYLAADNSYSHHLSEYRRLQLLVGGYDGRELSESALCELQGVLLQLQHLGQAIVHYLQQQQRILQFDQALEGGLSAMAREIFINQLQEKMKSPQQCADEHSRKLTWDTLSGRYSTAIDRSGGGLSNA